MNVSRKQIALLFVAKGKLDLSEEDFRSALVHVAGVASTKDLDTDGFNALMGLFEYMGFAPLTKKGQNYGDRPGMASFAQIELIRVLWDEFTRNKYQGEDELNKWLERTWKVSSLRFLQKASAQKVITALKAMKSRAA